MRYTFLRCFVSSDLLATHVFLLRHNTGAMRSPRNEPASALALWAMKCTLHLGEPSRFHSNSNHGPAYRYEVQGLPDDSRASIADFSGTWKILRLGDNPGNWTGQYSSAREALAALQKEMDAHGGVIADI
jgi:hypothetical protein